MMHKVKKYANEENRLFLEGKVAFSIFCDVFLKNLTKFDYIFE